MSARYELRTRGVFDNSISALVLPGSSTWPDYLDWVRAGNAPDPDSTTAAVPPTQAELDALAAIDDKADHARQLRANFLVQQLVTRKPAQVDDWINTNVTDLASAKVVLRVLAYVVALLARERLGL